MNKINLAFCLITVLAGFTSCEDDDKYISPALDGLTLDIEVGGPTQPNQVFVDLLRGNQSSVQRSGWDLGFYAGADFRVIINPAAEALVKKLDKNDLTSVAENDTLELGSRLSLDAIFNAVISQPTPDWVSEAVSWVDDPAGDLNGTAIGEISATDENNFVFVINRGKRPGGSNIGWMKFRISREGNGYQVQYAAIASATFSTASISKDASLNFNYFNFDQGSVSVEPAKADWEISFTNCLEILNFGVNFPYRIRDYVLINRNDVSVSEVILDQGQQLETEFENFSRSDAAGLTFNSEINAIGSNWRTVASPTPGSVTAVKSDRFYVIRNSAGNYFKLIFTAMLNNSGERGYPQIHYQILE